MSDERGQEDVVSVGQRVQQLGRRLGLGRGGPLAVTRERFCKLENIFVLSYA